MLTRGEEFWIHLCALAVTTVVAVAIFAAPKSFIDACWVPKDQESYHVSSLDIKWQSGQTFFILYYSAQVTDYRGSSLLLAVMVLLNGIRGRLAGTAAVAPAGALAPPAE